MAWHAPAGDGGGAGGTAAECGGRGGGTCEALPYGWAMPGKQQPPACFKSCTWQPALRQHGAQQSVEFGSTVIKPTTSNSPRGQPNMHILQPAHSAACYAWPHCCRTAAQGGPPGAPALQTTDTAEPRCTPAIAPLQEALPAPMVPGNYERRSSACLLQRAFEAVVVKQKGFEW